MIRTATLNDAEQLCVIYNHYILNSVATFEETPISVVEMAERIRSTKATLPWLVFEKNNIIIGYAYASTWKNRSAYKHTAESTVYLQAQQTAKGVGTQLYKALIDLLLQQNYCAIIGGISLPNKASIALHEKLGFVKVAHFKKVGFKFKQWVDVGYWELLKQ